MSGLSSTLPSWTSTKRFKSCMPKKNRLDRVIASLEHLRQGASPVFAYHLPGKRHGRKSMSARERQEVSLRMRKVLNLKVLLEPSPQVLGAKTHKPAYNHCTNAAPWIALSSSVHGSAC